MLAQEALQLGAAEVQHVQLAQGDDVGHRWLTEQHRHLAEEVALGQARPILAVDADGHLAVEMT
jgi:hypothetical protein